MRVAKEKIKVGILGATGSVGQKFVQRLEGHPYFEITEVAASQRSIGKRYKDAVDWILTGKAPESVANLPVKACEPQLDCRLVFSALDSGVATEVETTFARAGHVVVSNVKNHRMDVDVPLLIPEVNPAHLELLPFQRYGEGKIVTNPNCSTIGLVMAIKPLLEVFGLEAVNVMTMQAVSGAGFPGLSSMQIMDNVIPYIDGEEEKLQQEPLKILGRLQDGAIKRFDLPISAQCNRVAVTDGHTASVQLRLKQKAEAHEIMEVWKRFRAEPQKLQLPSAPGRPIHYFTEPGYPQPRLHRNLEKGMAVAIGGLRDCPLFDYKFTVLSHNTDRGAAGGAILCAELLKEKGYLT